MQTKLTLRIEDSLIRKAKRLAKRKGTSVSHMFGQYLSKEPDDSLDEQLPPITSSMLGVIKTESLSISEDSYEKHLEEKYL